MLDVTFRNEYFCSNLFMLKECDHFPCNSADFAKKVSLTRMESLRQQTFTELKK